MASNSSLQDDDVTLVPPSRYAPSQQLHHLTPRPGDMDDAAGDSQNIPSPYGLPGSQFELPQGPDVDIVDLEPTLEENDSLSESIAGETAYLQKVVQVRNFIGSK